MKIKNRILALIIAFMFVFASAAGASSPKTLFKYVKNTLRSLAAGDYDTIVSRLPVSGISPDSAEWSKLATQSFSSLSGSSPQTKYAVAYRHGDGWRIAVPVSTPDDPETEVFFLDTEDGKTFCGYGKSTWEQTVNEYRKSETVVWNEEYLGDTSSVEADRF